MTFRLFKDLLKGDFLKSVSIMLIGSFFSQLLPILVSPYLTRIYQPHEFGAFALFFSVCTVLTIIVTGYYELAILKLKKHKEVLNLCLIITILVIIICSILSVMAILLVDNELINLSIKYLENSWLIVLGVIFNSIFQITTYYLTWKANYLFLNKIKITQSIIIIITSIGLGNTIFKSKGLIISYIIGYIIASLPMLLVLVRYRRFLSFRIGLNILSQYIRYPMYTMPSAFINNLASQLPIFFIKKYFTKELVGEYSLTNRVLIAPVSIISVSLGQVYLKKISDKSNRNESLNRIFYGTFLLLTMLSIFIFIPLFLLGEEIVVLIFGGAWRTAGILAEILSIAVLIKFIVSPLSTIFFAINENATLTKWQVLYFISSLIFFLFVPKQNIILFFVYYSFHEVLLYFLYFIMMVLSLNKYEISIRNNGKIKTKC